MLGKLIAVVKGREAREKAGQGLDMLHTAAEVSGLPVRERGGKINRRKGTVLS